MIFGAFAGGGKDVFRLMRELDVNGLLGRTASRSLAEQNGLKAPMAMVLDFKLAMTGSVAGTFAAAAFEAMPWDARCIVDNM